MDSDYLDGLGDELSAQTILNKRDKKERLGVWGHLNHCVYRFEVPVHIVFCPKRRKKCFVGIAPQVQDIVTVAAERVGLEVLAIAAEPDHIHLLAQVAGPGGMPPNWSWSKTVGQLKAYSSAALKRATSLTEFEWQTGYSICAVTYNQLTQQNKAEVLAAVVGYITAQGDQEELEPGP